MPASSDRMSFSHDPSNIPHILMWIVLGGIAFTAFHQPKGIEAENECFSEITRIVGPRPRVRERR